MCPQKATRLAGDGDEDGDDLRMKTAMIVMVMMIDEKDVMGMGYGWLLNRFMFSIFAQWVMSALSLKVGTNTINGHLLT